MRCNYPQMSAKITATFSDILFSQSFASERPTWQVEENRKNRSQLYIDYKIRIKYVLARLSTLKGVCLARFQGN